MKYLFCFFIAFLFLITYSDAQNKITGLESKLANAGINDKPNICLELAKLYLNSNPQKAIDYATQGISYEKKVKLTDGQKSLFYNVLGAAYYKQKDFKRSIKYYEKELEWIELSGDKTKLRENYFNIAVLCNQNVNTKKSIEYFNKSLELAKNENDKSLTLLIYNALVQIYEKEKKYKEAYDIVSMILGESHLKLEQISVLETENRKAMEDKRKIEEEKIIVEKELQKKEVEVIEKETQLDDAKKNETKLKSDTLEKSKKINVLNKETQKKEKQIKARERKLKELRQTIVYIAIFLAVVTVLSFFLFRLYRQKKSANKKLQLQNDEILRQKQEIQLQHDEIEKKNKKITESIRYAQRIQQAILPNKELINKLLPNSFVLFRPRDVVSGDFYWMTEIEGKIVYVTADCTGHGVPGAFMSMLGMAFLNDIINKQKIVNPAEVLTLLRDDIILTLQQENDSESQDGMDVVVIVIERATNKLFFAGANNPAYIISNNEMRILEADPIPAGIYPKIKQFNYIETDIKNGDIIYTFTDGFVDQIGGDKQRKFMYGNFREFLLSIHKDTLEMQREKLNTRLDEWRGKLDQLDDVLILGVRF